jgi:hypothetical protein
MCQQTNNALFGATLLFMIMSTNTLVDDTEDNDDISRFLRNVEIGFLSEKQLRKLEKIRQDDKTP